MEVRLTRNYNCAPLGYITEKHKAGDILRGRAAELALADGAGVEAGQELELETKVVEPEETKRRSRRRAK